MLLGLQQTVFICVVSDSTGHNAVLLLSCNKNIKVPVHTMEACKCRRDIAPLLLTLSTRWSVINFIPCPLYSRKKKNPVHIEELKRRLIGLQSQTTYFEHEENLLPCQELNLGFSNPQPPLII